MRRKIALTGQESGGCRLRRSGSFSGGISMEPLGRRAFAALAAALIAALAAEGRADELGIGARTTLWELVRPDRFGWPAVFTCKRRPGDHSPIAVYGDDPDDMNERLVAAGIWPGDCRGGFSIRSTWPHPGKIEEIKGRVRGGTR
jgi:hypothetical protein